ncbi:hypothetical protein BGX21_001284 [Mortierella sp. AD011]|nr:hypothetical protein BGX20_008548 [Mortierella sp. AD010]KAF9384488.1 hypothetical protein BGX21_001284 [Mortierella sp. AD011]
MSRSPSRIHRSKFSLILLFIIVTFLCLSSVQAQDFPSDPDEPTPTVDEPTITPSAVPSATTFPGVTTTTPAVSTATPIPIFSNSEACQSCSPEFVAMRDCTQRLGSMNLTMANQVLPFFQCACANDGAIIDAIQNCSICLRSTGQQAFINPTFYNVTNQDVKSMMEFCTESSDGTSIPSGSNGRWGMLLPSASWGVLSSFVLLVLSSTVF